MVSKLVFVFCVLTIGTSSAQKWRDFISSPPTNLLKTVESNFTLNPPKSLNEYYAYSNHDLDTFTFDILFDKNTLNLKSNEKIRVELRDGNRVVYNRTDSVGHYKNVHLTNYPTCTNCYAIRLNLSKSPNLFANESTSEIYNSLKLFVIDVNRNSTMYGNGANDLKFIFMSEPEEEEE
jgi:hypothetical protein